MSTVYVIHEWKRTDIGDEYPTLEDAKRALTKCCEGTELFKVESCPYAGHGDDDRFEDEQWTLLETK